MIRLPQVIAGPSFPFGRCMSGLSVCAFRLSAETETWRCSTSPWTASYGPATWWLCAQPDIVAKPGRCGAAQSWSSKKDWPTRAI